MRNKITITLLALGVALPVVGLQAQESQDRPAREGRGPRSDRQIPGIYGALDANRDRTLDKAEIAGATDALKKLDKDGDSKLTMAELRGNMGRGPRAEAGEGERPNRERRGARSEGEERAGQRPRGAGAPDRPGPGAGGPFIAALDANKDGTIDADELNGAPAALLKLDKNGDGQITLEEMQIVRGRGPGARGDGDGDRPERPRGPRGERGDRDSANE
jgi:hypothetical protein